MKTSFFTLKLDFDKSRVIIWFGNEQERLGDCLLNADEVTKQIQFYQKQLGCGLACDKFIEKLKTACRTGHQKVANIPIINVLVEMAMLVQTDKFKQNPTKEYYRSYSRADFSYDLFHCREKLLKEGLKLTVATRQYTQRSKDYLWIPNSRLNTEGTAYSHLGFQAPEEKILL